MIGKQDADLFHTIKKNIVGGPSIIFTRHHKTNETYIRNSDNICQSIVGYDANALYLWALSQPMPVGIYIRRFVEDQFSPKIPLKYVRMYYWMEYLNATTNCNIKHKMNSGKEMRI